jgi:uncharacterized protein with von Willebrand factor type A (vWA) domain
VLDTLTRFVEELRAVGVPVSMVETLDAGEALRHADLGDRDAVKAALGATLVKNVHHVDAFETAFEVFFGLLARPEPDAGDQHAAESTRVGDGTSGGSAAGGSGAGDADALFEAILDALQTGDADRLRDLVRRAVDRLSGIEPGRPVGGRYYFYRVMQRLDGDRLARMLRESIEARSDDPLDSRVATEAADDRMERLRTELRREIVRRLVADRGAEAVARTLRTPLIEDLDLMHATREELERIERTIQPLARKLATRLAQRRRRGRRGRLDVRRTIRRSLAHGGVLLEPRFKPPRKSKPELVLLCDVSGSMATFARFTMQLTFAVGSQFSRVRSFAFIDGLDEVTGFFGPGADFHEAIIRMGREARLVWRDGHSDYGNAFEQFLERHGDAVTPRTSVIVTGDARNNYRSPRRELLEAIAGSARTLQWLNPEARRYWDTGDSIMSHYAPICDGLYEMRTIRQLEEFIERVALRTAPTMQRRPVPIG